MAVITVIAAADISAAVNGPSDLNAEEVTHVNALNMVRVRVRLQNGASGTVAVRPWYWRDDQWWPLRGSAANGGAAPLWADPALFDGKAEGYFAALGLSHPVAMVQEDGTGAEDDVTWCDIEAAEGNL